ncbi:MAG: T9SS type A sorting domain-containing protein, partial [Flavobacteriales bacterium]
TATEAVNIDVYGADGKLVIRAAASIQNNLLIENQQLASGIYTLVVSDAQGSPIATLKAVR